MGVTSIRLNKNEEKILNYLKQHLNCDTSTLLKKSLMELYEDTRDREAVENFEKQEKNGNIEFIEFDKLF